MATTPVPDHVELLTLAREVQLAAAVSDAHLDARIERLARGIRTHVEADRAGLDRLPPPVASLLHKGQERLLDALSALEKQLCRDEQRCLVRAAELTVLLGRQALLERQIVDVAAERGLPA
jgi:hypothetical protein